MKISVVIPTHNEEKRIANCLEALEKNTRKPGEIILVDGGSEDQTVQKASSLGVKVINNPRQHAAAGRNIGIEAAEGEIIAFTDADCLPETTWIESIHQAFQDKALDGLGGHVEPADPENEYEAFWGMLSLRIIMSFGEEAYVVNRKTLNQGLITANCAYRKELLQKLKGFDEWFANHAEDIDLTWRALEYGARLTYVPSVRVKAHSPTSLEGIKEKSFRNGYASSKLRKRYGSFFNVDPAIYRELLKHMKGSLRGEQYANLYVLELLHFLKGKYYGSLKTGVINL